MSKKRKDDEDAARGTAFGALETKYEGGKAAYEKAELQAAVWLAKKRAS